MTRIDRDQLGLLLARAWALRSTCPRRRVGCVLWDARGRELSTGYNGVPSGQDHCIDAPCPGALLASGTGLDACEAVHAEANALIRCPDPDLVRTCYVTSSPCLACVKLLLNTWCRRIVFAERYAHDAEASERWLREEAPGLAGPRRWDLVPPSLAIVGVGA